MLNAAHIQKEQTRQVAQVALDAIRTQAERNKLGQFATPPALAADILSYAKKIIPNRQKVSFFDPAFGTGSFYAALLKTFSANRISSASGYEVDPHYGGIAFELWAETGLNLQLSDFTKAKPFEEKFNLIICNPPYVRHHHILNGEKARIQKATREACGVQIGGLAGLYCYFLGLSHAWMTQGGIAGWLIPSEFMDVNYGEALKEYLLNKVTLLHIHRFNPQDIQFNDAIVSSAVVWFKKEKPPQDYDIEFSYGGTLATPKITNMITAQALRDEIKWTRFPLAAVRIKDNVPTLADFFSIRRGLATGDNSYFILTADQIAAQQLPQECFRPILPSPRYLNATEVLSDEDGNPIIEKPLFLLDCRLPETEIKKRYPTLWAYLLEGKKRGVADRYLCNHRTPWYSQENRPESLFVCTYLGRENTKRSKPFRFILNWSRATVTNVYLNLYPKPLLAQAMSAKTVSPRQVWELLDRICPQAMLDESRVYGGGLRKLEPKELARVPAVELAELFSDNKPRLARAG